MRKEITNATASKNMTALFGPRLRFKQGQSTWVGFIAFLILKQNLPGFWPFKAVVQRLTLKMVPRNIHDYLSQQSRECTFCATVLIANNLRIRILSNLDLVCFKINR